MKYIIRYNMSYLVYWVTQYAPVPFYVASEEKSSEIDEQWLNYLFFSNHSVQS